MFKTLEHPLYHGTIEEIPFIDVMRGRPRKDFDEIDWRAYE